MGCLILPKDGRTGFGDMASFFGVGSVGLGYLPMRRVKGKREPRLGALHFCIDLSTDSDDTTMNVQGCYASCDAQEHRVV
jgi:hypothetical protein